MGMKSEITSETGSKGLCELRYIKDKAKIIVAQTNKVHEIDIENVRCNLPEDYGPRKVYPNLYYKLNSDEDILFELRPYGTDMENRFMVSYKWIPHADGENPKTYTSAGRKVTVKKTGKDLWIPEHEQFNVEFDIIAGKYKGMTIKASLAYQFAEDDEGNVMIAGHGQWFSGWARELEQFIMLAGFDFTSDNIRWSDDDSEVLVELNDILSARKNVIDVKIVNGWVREFVGGPPDGVTFK